MSEAGRVSCPASGAAGLIPGVPYAALSARNERRPAPERRENSFEHGDRRENRESQPCLIEDALPREKRKASLNADSAFDRAAGGILNGALTLEAQDRQGPLVATLTGVGSVISVLKLGVIAALTATAALLSAASAGEIEGIRFGETSADETRVVLDVVGDIQTDGAPVVGPQSLSLTFDRATKLAGFASSGRGKGIVASYAFRSSTSVSLDLVFKSPSKIKSLFVIPPSNANPRHRLVIDLERGAPPPAPVAAATLSTPKYDTLTEVIEASIPAPAVATSAPGLKPSVTPATPVASVSKPVIVIDPGHGGSDPGAAGASGAKEAAVNLAAALVLAETLEKSGRYEVVLTRKTDSRLAHDERSRLAREAKADLFISLHADAHGDTKVRGASVYTLSEEGSERSAREALAQGNYHVFDVDIGQTDPQVGGILYNLAQRKTENESDRFAEILVNRLKGTTPLLNNSHRRGNFKVLLAPDVPAVLLELAFISNAKDEANLKSEAWRKRTMASVASAIDAYFEERRESLHAGNIPASPTR
jgi:N-acetylmuramoyl-L-alanine amidase